MSGGIDSSVCAAIAVQALGPENVVALGLPTQFTAPESLADAQTLADRIGIEYHCFSIETIFNQLQSELTGLLKSPVPAVTWENIQPRLRMTILMALSNARGLFLLNTSNKSEIATGFSTLYGDSAGALSLLGDVTKTQVYRLAEYLNRSGEIIPPRVLTRAPTAELRAHQVDQDVLPPYPILDTLIQTAIVDKKNLAPSPDKATQVFIDKFLTMVAHSEYKRGQLGPTLRVSARAFGMGRRVPVAASP
jgi:NAD+ synthase (glutamine-hydrolysing)